MLCFGPLIVVAGRSCLVLLGFLCFEPANVECFVLSLPERSLYCEYCTVVLYAVPLRGRLTLDLRIM